MNSLNSRLAEDEIDLRQYLRVLWRRRHTVGVVTLSAVIGAFIFSYLSPPVYEAQAAIWLSEHSASIYATPASAAQALRTPSFLDAAVKASGVSATERELQKLMKVEPVRDTRIIRVKVRYKDARQAQALADAIARGLISRASERVEQKQKLIQERLVSVDAQLAEIQRILQLTGRTLSRLQQGRALTGEERDFARSWMSISEALYRNVNVAQRDLSGELLKLEPPALIEPPSIPLEPVAPRKVLNTGLAAILGLAVGAMLALVIEYFSGPVAEQGASPAASVTPTPSRR